MDRRSFLKLMAGVPFLAAAPSLGLPNTGGESALDFSGGQWSERQLEYIQKIKMFEAQLEKLNGEFSWFLHNELRHYYGAFSEARSSFHSNELLTHSVMDRYILNTLSDWHYSSDPEVVFDPELAIHRLLRRAELYPQFSYMGLACLLRAGEISQETGKTRQARALYQDALSLCGGMWDQSHELKAYERLSQKKLLAIEPGSLA